MVKKNREILVFGPLPPPYGGIASIVHLLNRASFDDVSVRVIETTLRNTGSLGRLATAVRTLFRLIVSLFRYRPSDVLCFSGAFGSFWEKTVWADIGRLFGVRTAVVMVDGNFPRFEQGLGQFGRQLLKRRLHRYHIVGVQSEGWLKYFRELCPAQRYAIVVGGVDVDSFTPAGKPRVPAIFQIVYVGWMIEDKGIYELITAAGKLKSCPQPFRIRLIGPLFDQETRLRQTLATENLEDCVQIVGTVAHRDGLIDEYRSSDLFVLPSYAEGFPNSILEAMAVGLPVVATNVGGIPEIVDDGSTGILVPPRNSDALAAAIAGLMGDATACVRMGTASRSKVMARYTLQSSLESYRRLFQLLSF